VGAEPDGGRRVFFSGAIIFPEHREEVYGLEEIEFASVRE